MKRGSAGAMRGSVGILWLCAAIVPLSGGPAAAQTLRSPELGTPPKPDRIGPGDPLGGPGRIPLGGIGYSATPAPPTPAPAPPAPSAPDAAAADPASFRALADAFDARARGDPPADATPPDEATPAPPRG